MSKRRRKNDNSYCSSITGSSTGTSCYFCWAPLPGARNMMWPVQLIKRDNESESIVFCKSDETEFRVKSSEIVPFFDNYLLKDCGTKYLTKKKKHATLNCFLSDLEWIEKVTSQEPSETLHRMQPDMLDVISTEPPDILMQTETPDISLQSDIPDIQNKLETQDVQLQPNNLDVQTQHVAPDVQKNQVGRFKDKSLSDVQMEDVVFNGDSEKSCREITEIVDSDIFDESKMLSDDSDTEIISNRKRPTITTKTKWSDEEEAEIQLLFSKFIQRKKRPTPADCLKAMQISKDKDGIIWKRKKDVLKKKMFRIIDKIKRQ